MNENNSNKLIYFIIGGVAIPLIAALIQALPNLVIILQNPTPIVINTPTPNTAATSQAEQIEQAVAATLAPQQTATTYAMMQAAIHATLTAQVASAPTHTPMPPPSTDTPKAVQPQIGDQWTNPKDGAVYVYVPAGEFLMGSSDEQIDFFLQEICPSCERDSFRDEQPAHLVYLDAFWMMQTEVTNAQYAKCVEAGACEEPSNNYWDDVDKAAHPVVHVSWHQANRYVEWVGGRLPTEAEWEKAARGTDGRIYPWGNEAPNESLLNYDFNVGNTTPVGNYPNGASPYGALDMAGNVWEWTADWYDANYYELSPERNPQGPSDGTRRVLRGGSFDFFPVLVYASARIGDNPDLQGYNVGMRVVAVPRF